MNKSIQIGIEGMTCGGCVRSVTNALSQTQGISEVQVSLEQKSAQFKAEDEITESQLRELIDEIGFELTTFSG